MRKNLLVMLVLTAMGLSVVAQKNNSDKRERIKGSGNVISKDFTIKPFTDLKANGIYTLHLSQAGKESLKIEAEDNLMDLFIVEHEGSTLKISMKKDVDINSTRKMNVYVTFTNLKTMNLSMVGGTLSDEQLKFSDLKLKNQSVGSVNLDMALKTLHLENESVGNLKLTGSAENAIIKSNSVGSVQAGDFVVQKMEIDNNGVGAATVNAEKELRVSDSFLGKVSNKGSAAPKKKVRS